MLCTLTATGNADVCQCNRTAKLCKFLLCTCSSCSRVRRLCGLQAAQPVQVLRCQVVDNPLLTPELTVPLMDVQGTLSEGYSRGRAGQPPSYVPSS